MEEVAAATDHSNNNKAGDNDEARDSRTPSHPAQETRGGKQRHRDTPQLRAVSPIHLPPRSEPSRGRRSDSGFTRTQMLIVVTVTIVRVGAGDRTIPCPRQNALCRVCVPVSCRLISILIWRQVEVKYAQLFTVSKMCIFKHLFQHIRSLLYFLPGCQPMFLLVPSIGSDRIPSIF